MFFRDFEFSSKLCRKVSGEKLAKHDKVERYGYIPFAKRVIQMEQAGLNLLNIRAEMCDFKPDDAIDWQKDFRRLDDFDRFQQEEMAKAVAEKYQKMLALQEQNAMIQHLTEQGYSVQSAEEVAAKLKNDEADEQNSQGSTSNVGNSNS